MDFSCLISPQNPRSRPCIRAESRRTVPARLMQGEGLDRIRMLLPARRLPRVSDVTRSHYCEVLTASREEPTQPVRGEGSALVVCGPGSVQP